MAAVIPHEAYTHCQAVTRAGAKNFYYAFITLPRRRRWAISAAYAFLRLCDDVADAETPVEEKRRRLTEIAHALEEARAGRPQGPVFTALAHAAHTFGIPWGDLHEALRGVETDLERRRYRTFEELQTYCYGVASVVGLICIQIFGYKDPRARAYAVELGLAMQLTNILRDLGEDGARDRIYLPQEELVRFGYSEEELLNEVVNDHFRDLMRFQVARAREHFRRSRRLLPLLPLLSRPCPAILAGIYSRILDHIEARGYDVFSERVSLSSREKLFLATRLWAQSLVPLARVAKAW